jgi:hypothetical protein
MLQLGAGAGKGLHRLPADSFASRVVSRHVRAAVHDGSSLFKAAYAYRWNEITDRNAGYA